MALRRAAALLSMGLLLALLALAAPVRGGLLPSGAGSAARGAAPSSPSRRHLLLQNASDAAHLQMLQWAAAERRAKRWRRTRTELDRFSRECAWISEAYVRAVRRYEELDRVVVFDVRHGTWTGLGDSVSRLLNLLRVSRAMGRAGFILADPCADPHPPRRYAATPRSDGTACAFDLAAFVRGFGPGVDYQWGERARRRVEQRLGAARLSEAEETVLSMHCPPGAAGAPCELRDARTGAVVFSTPAAPLGGAPEPGREMDWVRFLQSDPVLSAAPFVRIELTDMADLFFLYEHQGACRESGINLPPWWDQATGGCFQNCEWFALLRPKTVLWNALRPSLDRADRWDGLVALSARTGFADHAHAFPELRSLTKDHWGGLTQDRLVREVEGVMRQCPEGTRKAWRERVPGAEPCVMWSSGIEQPVAVPTPEAAAETCNVAPVSSLFKAESKQVSISPSSATGGPFGAYIDCAARQARALAGGSDRWGVFLMSDAPALKCVAEGSPLAERHLFVTPTAWGHLQYAGGGGGHERVRLRRLSVLAVADFYLLGICEHFMMMFTSAFPDQAVIRSKLASDQKMAGFDHAYEVWFYAGREAARGRAGADPKTLALLGASTEACPLQQPGRGRRRARGGSSGGGRWGSGAARADDDDEPGGGGAVGSARRAGGHDRAAGGRGSWEGSGVSRQSGAAGNSAADDDGEDDDSMLVDHEAGGDGGPAAADSWDDVRRRRSVL